MRLVTKIKLKSSFEQKLFLKETLSRCSEACNYISSIVFLSGVSNRIDLQKLLYFEVKESFDLSAQMSILCIHKTANDYHSKNFSQRYYSEKSSIAFDDRVLTISTDKKEVSIWTVSGRQKIPFLMGKKQKPLLNKRIGQSDLLFEKGKFFLLVGYEEEEEALVKPQDFLGVDLGIKKLAMDSEREAFTGKKVEEKRQKYARRRKNLQKNSSKNAKRALCKLRKKERNFRTTQNHEIAKRLVLKAKGTHFGIALEDLKGIRKEITVRKKERSRFSSWSFGQLRSFIEYKAALHGVTVIFVDPKNTSRTCPKCGYTDKKNRKSQSEFCCCSCGYFEDADFVGALNIRQKARYSYGWDAIRTKKVKSADLSQSFENLLPNRHMTGTATQAFAFRRE